MRKHTLTAYRKLIRLFGLLGLLSVFLFSSCEDLQADESEEKSLSSSKTYTVSFKVADAAEDSSSDQQRNIYPSKIIVGGLSFLLQGEPIMPPEGYDGLSEEKKKELGWNGWTKDESRTMDGDTKLLNGIQYPTKEELDKASFNLDSGAWKFLLKAYEGEYSAGALRLTAVSYVREITAGNNVITFNMKLADDIPDEYKYGSIKLVLNCYLGENTCSVVGNKNASDKGITVSLTKYKEKSTETIDENFDYASIVKTITVGETTNDASGKTYTPVSYETENTIPKGEYSIFVKIPLVYGEDSEGNPKQTFATFKDTEVVVETGSQSYLNKDLTDLRQRYTIEYKSVEVTHNETGEDEYEVVDFNYFNNEVDVFEYNPSSKTKVVLPEIVSMTRDDKVFLGWYDSYDETTHKFGKEAEEYASKTSFSPTGLTGIKTFWAQWGDLDIYVSEDGDDKTGKGSLTSPYKTLTQAIKRIHDYPNKNLEWNIYIMGSVTAESDILSKTVSGSNGISAGKIIITGYNKKDQNDKWDGADELVSSTTGQYVLKVNTDFPVELSYLAIKHNYNAETEKLTTGSGLKFGENDVSDTKITLKHVKVFNNEVTNNEGAGISNYMDLTLINCEISNNKANLQDLTTGSAGGGIYNRNALSLTDCVISNNSSGEKGGGIYNSGTLNINNCTISKNSTSYMGGGVHNENKLTITKSTFDGNSAMTQGGAIYSTTSNSSEISDCTVTIAYTTFTSNTASGYGGAIAMKGSSNNKSASITLNNNVIIGGEDGKGNTAEQYGGGIYISGSKTILKITGSDVDISWNKAGTRGAGIYLEYANLDMESEGTINNNKDLAETNGILIGGGIYAYEATATLKGKIFDNKALKGAGLYSNNSCITLTGSIQNNEATENGGGIYFEKGILALTSTVLSITMGDGALVSGNRAKNGGGLYCVTNNTNPSVFAMNGGTVSGNTASENGGGVYIVGGDDTAKFTFNMAAGNISGNTASTNGGGVYIGQYAEMFMYGSAVVGDAKATATATSGANSNSAVNGGGIYNAGKLYMGYKTIEDTTSETSVTIITPTLTALTNGVVYNYATSKGGGVYNTADFYFGSGSVGYNATPSNGFGGGIYNSGNVYMHGDACVGLPTATNYASAELASNYAGYGGGICNEKLLYLGYKSETEVAELQKGIIGNRSANGAGIYIGAEDSSGVPQTYMSSGIVKHNWASANGGGVLVNTGAFNFSSGKVEHNRAGKDGGGIYITAGTMYMYGDSVIGDSSQEESASGSDKCSNYAKQGGGIYNHNGTVRLGYKNSSEIELLTGGIYYNYAFDAVDEGSSGGGGGIYNEKVFDMSSGHILYNSASQNGTPGYYGEETASGSVNSEINNETYIQGAPISFMN